MNREQFLSRIVADVSHYSNAQDEISSADVINIRKIALSQFALLGFSGANPPPLDIYNEQMAAVVENYKKTFKAPENS